MLCYHFLVYGRPSLVGQVWSAVATFDYFSIVFEFSEPVTEGFLNRIQIYTIEAGVSLVFQVWRSLAVPNGGRRFLLVDEFPYTTRQANTFENTVSCLAVGAKDRLFLL